MTTTFLIVYPAMAAAFAAVVTIASLKNAKRRDGEVIRIERIAAYTWGFLLGMVWPLSMPLFVGLVLYMLASGRDRGAL